MKHYLWVGVALLCINAHASENPFELKANFGKLEKEQSVLLSKLKKISEAKELAEEQKMANAPVVVEPIKTEETVISVPTVTSEERLESMRQNALDASKTEAEERNALLAKAKKAKKDRIAEEQRQLAIAKKEVEAHEVEAYEKARAERVAKEKGIKALPKSIVGKWEIDTTKTKQSIDKLSMDENEKKLFMRISLGFKFIECFKDNTCILNTMTDNNSCMGHFHWRKTNNNYALTPYTDKLCSDNAFNKKAKITIKNNELNFLIKDETNFPSFIYSKIHATQSEKPLNNLSIIQYDKIYKSKKFDIYSRYTYRLIPVYFYLFFTDKTKFYSIVTTQSDISSINEIKNIIQKKNSLSTSERLQELAKMSDSSMNFTQLFSAHEGNFSPNKKGLEASFFNSYFNESDVRYSKDKSGISFEVKNVRRCDQITFMSNSTLSCNNGIKYTLLDKNNAYSTSKVTAQSTSIDDINITQEKLDERLKADEEFAEAVKEMGKAE